MFVLQNRLLFAEMLQTVVLFFATSFSPWTGREALFVVPFPVACLQTRTLEQLPARPVPNCMGYVVNRAKQLFTRYPTRAAKRGAQPTPSPSSKLVFTKYLTRAAPRRPRPTPSPQSKRLFKKALKRAAPQKLPARPVPICMGRAAPRRPRPIIHKILEQSCSAAAPGKAGTNLHGSTCPAKAPFDYSQNP